MCIQLFKTLLAFSSHPIKTPGGFSLTSSLTDSYAIHHELHIFPVKVLQGRKLIQNGRGWRRSQYEILNYFSMMFNGRRLPEIPRVHGGCRLRPAGAQWLYYPVCVTFPINIHHLTRAHTRQVTPVSSPPRRTSQSSPQGTLKNAGSIQWIWGQNTIGQVLVWLDKANDSIPH